MEQRVMSADATKVSRFEKEFSTAGAGARGQTGFFGRKQVKGSEFGGMKGFKTSGFKTQDFSQRSVGGNLGRQTSSFGNDSSHLGRSSFSTRSSSFANKQAGEGSKEFTAGGRGVLARTFTPGQSALEADKRPVRLVEPGAQPEKVAYTEDQVKSLLGR
jgi:hypothetical protein